MRASSDYVRQLCAGMANPTEIDMSFLSGLGGTSEDLLKVKRSAQPTGLRTIIASRHTKVIRPGGQFLLETNFKYRSSYFRNRKYM